MYGPIPVTEKTWTYSSLPATPFSSTSVSPAAMEVGEGTVKEEAPARALAFTVVE